jgi:hypothetical protein
MMTGMVSVGGSFASGRPSGIGPRSTIGGASGSTVGIRLMDLSPGSSFAPESSSAGFFSPPCLSLDPSAPPVSFWPVPPD